MSIQEHLNKIRNAIYGREVRESIAKGIETAYDDASEKDNANMEVKIARGTHPNLRSRLDETNAQLAQKVGNGKLASMLDLGQDIKTAMTGGSVAVVGEGAVTKVNLANDVRKEIESKVNIAEELTNEHVLRVLPNGVRDYRVNNTIVKNTKYVELDGTEGWRASQKDDFYNIRLSFDDIMGGTVERYILKQGDKTWEFAYLNEAFRHFYVYQGELRVYVEQSVIHSYDGVDFTAKFINFLKDTGTFELTYQLAEPVEIELPSRVTPNTKELLNVSAQVQAFIEGDRTVQDKKTGVLYSWVIEVEDGIPIIKLERVGD